MTAASDQAPAIDPFYRELMGRAALALNTLPRLKKFPVVDGGRRMLGEKTPRPVLNLQVIRRDES